MEKHLKEELKRNLICSRCKCRITPVMKNVHFGAGMYTKLAVDLNCEFDADHKLTCNDCYRPKKINKNDVRVECIIHNINMGRGKRKCFGCEMHGKYGKMAAPFLKCSLGVHCQSAFLSDKKYYNYRYGLLFCDGGKCLDYFCEQVFSPDFTARIAHRVWKNRLSDMHTYRNLTYYKVIGSILKSQNMACKNCTERLTIKNTRIHGSKIYCLHCCPSKKRKLVLKRKETSSASAAESSDCTQQR